MGLFKRQKPYEVLLKQCSELEVGRIYQIGGYWYVYLGYTEFNNLSYKYIEDRYKIQLISGHDLRYNSPLSSSRLSRCDCYFRLSHTVMRNSYKSVSNLINKLDVDKELFIEECAEAIRIRGYIYSLGDFKREDIAFSKELQYLRAKSAIAGLKIFSSRLD